MVGPHLRDLRPQPLEAEPAKGRFARQVLLFGDEGQAILRRLTVAIAGAGGGGSLIAESLAHLGVGRIIVIEFDRASESNLSRVVGATPEDAARGRLKTEVLEDLVARIDPTVAVTPIYGDITYTEDALRLAEADFASSRLTSATASSMRRESRSISAAVRSIVAIGVRSLQPARC